MPGVIQPQRSQSSMGNALQLGQAIMQAKNAFGGSGSGNPTPDQTSQPSAGNVGDSSQAAQGQAVPTTTASYNQNPPSLGAINRRIGLSQNYADPNQYGRGY